eukprot:756894-Amorphochlora_amoeboformis.AAC.2
MGMVGGGGSGSAAKGAARVSPRFFSEAMSLSYDIETKFLPFVAKQCVDHTEEGESERDGEMEREGRAKRA